MPGPSGTNSLPEQVAFARKGFDHAFNTGDREDMKFWQGYILALQWIERQYPVDGRQMCMACGGRGQWWEECCDGCTTCDGVPTFMGDCLACRGDGRVYPENQKPYANVDRTANR